jgi:putative ABC transport system permease protein
MNPLIVPVVAIVGYAAVDALRRPMLRRLALRNANRRRGEAVLVLIGSLLGTAIIVASLLTGTSLDASIRDFARTQLGPVDETVHVSGTAALPDAVRAVAGTAPITGTDGGPLPMVSSAATAWRAPAGGRPAEAEPKAEVNEVDYAAARRFGNDPASTGFARAGDTPRAGEADLVRPLADVLHLRPGDRFDLLLYGSRRTFTVRQVLDQVGLAGYYTGNGTGSRTAWIAPGTIAAIAAGSTNPAAIPPHGLVLVSNRGGVFDGAGASAPVVEELRRRVASVPGAEVRPLKHDLLRDADLSGKSFSQLFTSLGMFSVLAGVLLLVNIFVMLAEERKKELGMLRALGMRRNQLVRAFGLEGTLYAIGSAFLGALAGIGLGRAIVLVAASLFKQGGRRDGGLDLRFAAPGRSVLLGALAGLAISLVTVWLASVRIGRLNVIRAIRDLPDPPASPQQRLRSLILGASGAVVGALLFVGGLGAEAWFPAMVGPAVALVSITVLLRRWLPRRPLVSAVCLLVLAWGVGCFTLIPSVFKGVDVGAFVVQGVMLVVAAVVLITLNDEVFMRLASRMSGTSRALAVRLGLAYPLARRFRTGMTLAIYGLVIFVLTMLATFSTLFSKEGPRLTEETRAGYDVVLDSNPAAPATPEQLLQQPEVAAVTTFNHGYPEFTAPGHPERDRWSMTGFDEGLVGRGHPPKLSKRDARYASDRDAYLAVLAHPDEVILPGFFLQRGGGPPSSSVVLGDRVTVFDIASRARALTVVGIVDEDMAFNGALVSKPTALAVLGRQAAPDRAYVAVKPGLDPDAVARRLSARLVDQGADATSFGALVNERLQEQQGFFRLMQGYLALGLVVGVAGLGVIMVRAVRERRRQIGMLRAMGFSAAVVRAAFLFESTFVALQGIVVGVGLALIVSYQLMTNSSTFGDQSLGFSIPWMPILVLTAAALIASLLSTLAPATQASRVRPAVALRVAD